jgi:IS1 family transposase
MSDASQDWFDIEPFKDLRWGKRVPKDDEYDDEGTWIWISMSAETRLVLSHIVSERSQKSVGLLKEQLNVSKPYLCL